MPGMPGILDIVESQKDDVLVLTLKGRLDVITSSALEGVINDANGKNTKNVLINLSEIWYISSSGLKTLLTIDQNLRKNSGKLVICAVTPEVMQVIKMTGVLPLFQYANTEAEALGKFK